MLKTHLLRDFIAIAEAGSIRGAARALNLAQPALTRSLRELEQVLAASLVERHARGIVLTTVGQRFLTRSRAVLSELERGIDEARSRSGSPQTMVGAVCVAMSSAPMLGQLPAAYRAFRSLCPLVRLSVTEAAFPGAEPMLRSGAIDFFVGPRPDATQAPGYRTELLYKNERLVFARIDHPLQRATRLAHLHAAEWLYNGLRNRAEQDLEELFGIYGLPAPSLLTRIDSMLAVLTLLSASDALASLPRQWASDEPWGRAIRPIAIRERLAGPDIVLICKAGLPLTPAAELFAGLFRESGAKIAAGVDISVARGPAASIT